ncbi:MAG TPA: hypothetical protein VHG35_12495 [Gemmatimonadales bacterium]|nr:hypothetical protein [Gemmatimonadales bacterium]
MAEHKKSPGVPRQFGIFYPRGYVVLALRTADDAERVRGSLLEGGYVEDDVQLMPIERVLEGASADLEHLNPLVRALGAEAGATESHLASAQAGHTLLIAYAPSDLDTQRLMNVARRVGYVKAQKYDRFTVTDL